MITERFEEINVVKKRGRPGDLRVALLYPSIYRVAALSLSFQMIYYYVNRLEGFVCERFVLSRLRGDEPPLRSLERGSPLSAFDVVLISVHYEPDFVNVVRALIASGIEPLSERRNKPLVVAGGPPIMANPEPLLPFLDVAVVGEIEAALPYLVERMLELGADKRRLIDELPPERGFYTLNTEGEVVAAISRDLPIEFHPIAQFQPARGWERTTMIEVMRGCWRGCRFCLEGHLFLPKRDRPRSQVLRIALEGSKLNATKKVTLYSLSYFDHRDAERILADLTNEGLAVSIPSLRLETLDEDKLSLIVRGGQKTLTLAPETSSETLARALGKPLLRDKLLEVAATAKRVGFKGLKLYFMVGLPGERDEDAEGVGRLVLSISRASGFRGERELKVTLSPFVPKAQTPMQWLPAPDRSVVERRIELIKRMLGGIADVRVYDPRWATIQAVISRGDRELHKLLLAWARAGGGLGGWRRALKLSQIDPRKYLSPIPLDAELPWSRIRLLASKGLRARCEEYCTLARTQLLL